MSQTLYDFSARRLNGDEQNFDAYRGKVLLIVNTASQCGFTPQYSGLEELYRMYRDRGFVVLGFPCNQFAAMREAAGILGTEAIKWNFTKFLVDREGRVVHRYAPATRPDELLDAVEALL